MVVDCIDPSEYCFDIVYIHRKDELATSSLQNSCNPEIFVVHECALFTITSDTITNSAIYVV